ncbi:hypothetical protein [Cellulosilyticum sp. I15G10I2]|uniref:hypothetical protein n=1 Tax=Cellulosilyticum sp. I15G10I2 TaxID=1892843 RepID=UPI00085C1251|nr:hypothetical protein [Cellulosilyticum sp. I15G10I2]
MALTKGRNTIEQGSNVIVLKVKASTKIYEGALVAVDGGYAIPGKKATGLIAAGRAEEYVDNTGTGGTNGARSIRVKRGVFLFENDITNPVTEAHILGTCYILDDETVTSLETGASVAGKVLGFDGDQVIVEIR